MELRDSDMFCGAYMYRVARYPRLRTDLLFRIGYSVFIRREGGY
jgi:hypothetical protein